MSKVLFLHTPMPCEVGAVALYSCLDSTADIIEMDIKKSTDYEEVKKVLDKSNINTLTEDKAQVNLKDVVTSICLSEYPPTIGEVLNRNERNNKELNIVAMLGSYWNSNLPSLLKDYQNVKFLIHQPGETPVENTDRLTNFSLKDMELCDFVLRIAGVSGALSRNKTWRKFLSTNKQVIGLINDRYRSKNNSATQPLFTGLYNFTKEDLSLLERFEKLLLDEYLFEDVMKFGNSIVDMQISMTNERAVKNAKKFETTDGKMGVMTDAPELVNLTHEQLVKNYPNVDVTVIVNHKFSNEDKESDEQLAFSVRSYNDELNAEILVKNISPNGGGSKTAAGCRLNVSVTQHLPWVKHPSKTD